MTRICAWCKRVLEYDLRDTQITHGICALCRVELAAKSEKKGAVKT